MIVPPTTFAILFEIAGGKILHFFNFYFKILLRELGSEEAVAEAVKGHGGQWRGRAERIGELEAELTHLGLILQNLFICKSWYCKLRQDNNVEFDKRCGFFTTYRRFCLSN